MDIDMIHLLNDLADFFLFKNKISSYDFRHDIYLFGNFNFKQLRKKTFSFF